MRLFTGCACALVTPFTREGTLDEAALARLTQWHIAQKTDALVVCGTTGEASTMAEYEQTAALRAVVETAQGRVPVLAGVGGNDTKKVIAACRRAAREGAAGALAVTPYYNKTTQEGLIAHYTAVADASPIPVVCYNVPGRTGLNLLPATMAALSRHENIAGLKEAAGDMAQAMEMLRLCGPDFAVYSGCDELTLPLLACGGAGVISTAANVVPARMHALREVFRGRSGRRAAGAVCALRTDRRAFRSCEPDSRQSRRVAAWALRKHRAAAADSHARGRNRRAARGT